MRSHKIPIAIQLYSVRDVASGDIAGTLNALADMGYEGVEFAGTYGLATSELRKMLDQAGLSCAGAHVPLSELEGETLTETIATYRQLGTERLIIPYADMHKLDDVLPRIKAAQAKAEKQGIQLAFHNHQAEFETKDGITHLDRIFAEMPDNFLLELDIGWATAAKQDVSAIIHKYANRLQTVHVKEFDPDNLASVVGEGSVDWPSILTQLHNESAVEWFVVEQEKFRTNPLDSARGCIDNLRKMGW